MHVFLLAIFLILPGSSALSLNLILYGDQSQALTRCLHGFVITECNVSK